GATGGRNACSSNWYLMRHPPTESVVPHVGAVVSLAGVRWPPFATSGGRVALVATGDGRGGDVTDAEQADLPRPCGGAAVARRPPATPGRRRARADHAVRTAPTPPRTRSSAAGRSGRPS